MVEGSKISKRFRKDFMGRWSEDWDNCIGADTRHSFNCFDQVLSNVSNRINVRIWMLF